jgi:hypothetical protein
MEGIGKEIKLFYDDGSRITIKIGVLKAADESFVSLTVNGKVEVIPTSRIVRMEVLE